MSTKKYSPIIIILLVVILLAGVGVVGLKIKTVDLQLNQVTQNKDATRTPELPSQPLVNEVHSGDGSMTLIRKVQPQPDKRSTYSFLVASLTGQDKNERAIFSQTHEPGTELSIPLNAWSPDNKYFFLQEKDQAGNLNFLAFKASGEPFTNHGQYLNVGEFFKEKLPKYTLRNATGWASPILINVNTYEKTENQEVKKGPDYWFDVQALAFWGHR